MRIARTTKDTEPRTESRLRELDRKTATVAAAANANANAPVASLYQAAVQQVPSDAYTSIRFDQALIDSHGGWSPSAPTIYRCPIDGVYLVVGYACVLALGRRATALRRNGLFVRASQPLLDAVSADSGTVSATKLVACQAGDELELVVFQGSGATQPTYADPVADTPAGSGFDVAWWRALPPNPLEES